MSVFLVSPDQTHATGVGRAGGVGGAGGVNEAVRDTDNRSSPLPMNTDYPE